MAPFLLQMTCASYMDELRDKVELNFSACLFSIGNVPGKRIAGVVDCSFRSDKADPSLPHI